MTTHKRKKKPILRAMELPRLSRLLPENFGAVGILSILVVFDYNLSKFY